MPHRIAAALLGLAVAVPSVLHTQQLDPRPAAAPADAARAFAVEIRRAPGAIRIDAELDDLGWEGAARVSGFTEFAPREGAAPPAETEVLLTYDDRNLYVAFIAHDDPAEVRASWRNRDQIWQDDNVGVLLDPYGNASLGYLLIANPYGIQADQLMTAQGEDDSWDAIFESAGRITENGYVVEMAIPFRSLRFPNRDVQSWRINFYRSMPRANRHQMLWAPFDLDNPCLLCQSGTLVGLQGVRPGGGLELLPSIVASRAGSLRDGGDPGSFGSDDPTADVSLGAKYAFSGGWTVEGTYNPDFSQVESDAAQIDVNTTFALFYPERRPFFQEGSDLYDTWTNVFYSRSINAPQFATKLTGRSGRTSVGYIGARDEITPFILPFEERSAVAQAGRSVTNVLRARHNLYDDSYVGALVTDRRLEGGGSGSNFSLDALLRFRRVYRAQVQLVGSYTVEPDDEALSEQLPGLEFGRGEQRYTAAFDGESYAGRSVYLGLSRSARFWSWDLRYTEATPTYRSDAGFQTRNDFRRVNAWTGVTFRPARYGVEQVAPGLGTGSIWNFDGVEKDLWLRPSLYVLLPYQTHVNVGGIVSRETFRDVEFDGIRRAYFSVSTTPAAAVQAGVWMQHGRQIARGPAVPVLGDGTDVEVWGMVRPYDRLVFRPGLLYSSLRDRESGEEFFSGYIARVRTEYQFTRELSVRVVTQYNDFADRIDVEPLIVYRLNPFSIFYVGSTQGYRSFEGHGWSGSDRQYFLKFQYLFQL